MGWMKKNGGESAKDGRGRSWGLYIRGWVLQRGALRVAHGGMGCACLCGFGPICIGSPVGGLVDPSSTPADAKVVVLFVRCASQGGRWQSWIELLRKRGFEGR